MSKRCLKRLSTVADRNMSQITLPAVRILIHSIKVTFVQQTVNKDAKSLDNELWAGELRTL